MVDNNYLKVPIYCNDAFGYDRGNGSKLDELFFEVAGPGEHRNRLLSISWSDLIVDGMMRSKPDVEGILHLALSPVKYNALKGAYRSAVRRYHVADGKSVSLLEYINSFRKGSKHFRKVICQGTPREKLSGSRQCKTFLRLIDCESPDTPRLSNLYTSWSLGFYPANVRVFLYKYYNNILGINSRVCHFNPLINGSCTFCGINGPYPPNNETIVHIFYDCPYVNDIIEHMASRYLHNFPLNQRSFFITDCCEYERDNKLLTIFWDVVRFTIWQSKLEKKKPTKQKTTIEVNYLFSIIFGSCRKLLDDFNNCPYFQRTLDGVNVDQRLDRRP
jgi:hypothetical protein